MSDTRNEPNNIDLASEVDGEDEGTSQGPIHLIPKIDLIPHTVFILCGPTSSGKSQFAEDISNLCESNILEVKVISSDAIRHRLLSESQVSPFGSANKYTDGMMTVSKQAFDLLMADYKAAISFPVSTPIVVLDTTGMDERFRETVLTMGKENGYKVILVTFEYKNRSDYFPETKTDVERAIIEKSVIKFRRKILPALKAKNFDARLRINSKLAFGWDIPREDTWWFEDSSTTWEEHAISDVAKQKRDLYDILNEDGDITVLDSSQVYAVIGDSHECVDELKQLIGLLPEGCVVVHVGDYLDKGGNTLEMVNYMYERHQKGDYILQGNHENYVYKRLRGQIEANEALEKDFFTSVTPLLENEEAREKFFSIFEQSYPFLVLNRFDIKGGLPVFISHAPCSNIHLGKVHDTALLAQRNYRVKDRTKPMVKDLAWLYKEAESIHPLHIFGHVTSIQTSKHPKLAYKNKVFLDTGAVYGGKLTAVLVSGGRITGQIQVQSKTYIEDNEVAKDLADGPKADDTFNIHDYDLDTRDFRLLDQVMDKGVQYISGTMAPAPSSNEKIEPLEGAFNWFRNSGINELTLQPKYMGSRCQLYLFKDSPEKTFAVSRGGWIIKGVHGKTDAEYQEFLKVESEKHKGLTDLYGDMILDGELLPWMALGEGLINTHFYPYMALVNDELSLLESDPGFALLGEFKDILDIPGRKVDLEKFQKALGLYSKDTPVEFRPFKILWNSDTKLRNWKTEPQNASFELINPGVSIKVDIRNEEDILNAKKYFDELTVTNGMEGVVAKPLDPIAELPYMKIRSEEYLRIVYGYDYTRPERYSRLCRQKNISGKVRTSIAEHRLADNMFIATGEHKKSLVVKMIGQMKQEKALDPRL